MAVFARLWRWLVEEHQGAVDSLFQGMAGRTGDIFMSSLERKAGLIVVEERGFPFVAVVA